jgi:hypothetical protein
MARLWQQIIRGEGGQALPIVLCLLLAGGLLIAPSLSYAATSLNAGETAEENASGFYAADAAMEEALWCIMNSISPPEQLSESVNKMQVARQTEVKGEYALYHGEMVQSGEHCDWLTASGEMVWNEEAEAYEYTITVTRQPEASGNIKLKEVGVQLPLDYSYQTDSAAIFGDNLSTDEPDIWQDWSGVYMLDWEFPPPRPEVSEGEPVRTQRFYITGEGEQTGDYSWVVAERGNIGVTSEITGGLYKIMATATQPSDGEVTASVVAYVLKGEAETHIVSWKVSPQ